MKKIIFLLALFGLFSSQVMQAQSKRAYNWYFGYGAAMTWNTTQTVGALHGLPTPLPTSAMTDQNEGVFGMSDDNGNLLFYSDGMTIWNKNHQVMSGITAGELDGNRSSAQSGIIIPYPGQSTKYIAFTINLNNGVPVGGTGKFSYSVVDMTGAGGLGSVITKNVPMTGAVGGLGESMSAVQKPDKSGYWIVAVGKGALPNSAMNVWEVTSAGVNAACKASYTLPVGTDPVGWTNGYLRFSANGKYFVWPEWLGGTSNTMIFGTFDPATGAFTNIKSMAKASFYGAEFSPSGKILYLSCHSDDLYAYKFADLLNSPTPATVSAKTKSADILRGLQLGPDLRIYGALASSTNMYVIDNVEDYDNFTTTTVSGLVTKEVRLGLPNYPPNLFAADLPDNIIEADCYGTPPASAFTIKELATSTELVDNNHVVVTGDIDADGYNEILVFGPGIGGLVTNVLRIYKFKDNQLVLQQNLTIPNTVMLANPLTIANVNGNAYSSIFICSARDNGNNGALNPVGDQQQLVKYDYNPTTKLYVEAGRVRHTNFNAAGIGLPYSGGTNRGYPMVADLNGDGIPEVVVHDRVFNARTLTQLADGGFYYKDTPFSFGNAYHSYLASMPALADIDNDGIPEYIGGDYVYKINITNPTAATGNTYQLYKTCSKVGHSEVTDGATAVADMDNDGFLDVVVVVPYENKVTNPADKGALYVYNPRTGAVMHNNIVKGTFHGGSQPFVGDVDGDGYPEICFTAKLKMCMYKLNLVTKQLEKKWEVATTDGSSATSMCMFDFNQDGKQELVYRDETHLRIINGETGADIAKFICSSSTSAEYPIVADVNNDGAVEIICTGAVAQNVGNGWLHVYASNPAGNWAPARRVWNQFAYNAVNVNNDLTIPKTMFNPATEFNGGSCGTVRPYNGYLMQQTMLSSDGCPIFLLPNVELTSGSFTIGGTMANVSIQLTNKGDAAIGPPVFFTVYKNSISSANIVKVDSINISLNAGETTSATTQIDTTGMTFTDLIVRINDRNNDFPHQQECATTNNTITLTRNTGHPDNIIEADCFGDPPSTPFSFKELTRSTSEAISTLSTPLVGDIDNDGKIEIVVGGGTWKTYCRDSIYIYECVNSNTIRLQQQIGVPYINMVSSGPYAIAKVDDKNNNGTCEDDYAAIFVCTANQYNSVATDKMKIMKFVYNGTQYVEETTPATRPTYSTVVAKEKVHPMLADFNGDGIPELFVLDKIYNPRTMTLIADANIVGNAARASWGLAFGGHLNFPAGDANYVPVVADIDGDGRPEIVMGHCAYKVNITNPNGTAGNSFTLYKECSHTDTDGNAHGESYDGVTSVADVDGDGQLDIVVAVTGSKNTLSGYWALYIWNPRTGNVINSNIVQGAHASVSPAFIGDINGNGKMNLVVNSYYKSYAYEYNPATKQLAIMAGWPINTNDSSAATSMSLFDFNQDGANELVYRDCTHLRILKSDGTNMIPPIVCGSATAIENPVIADINGDGSAEVIVCGAAAANAPTGHVRIFASDPAGMWAPARKVWNQFGYNAVNINEDLTVPKTMLNPATAFFGGTCNGGDTIYPYNGYLMQQTALNKFGCPIFLLPDASPSNPATSPYSGTSLIVNVDVTNTGDAAIGPPVYIAIYKNTLSAANLIGVGSLNASILPGATATVSDTIANISSKFPIANLIIRVNDDGTTYPYQQECNYSNEITVPYVGANNRKDARLNLEVTIQNGTLGNPVAVLYGDEIKYEITAVNASLSSNPVVIRDTLPLYADYVPGSAVPVPDGGGVTSTLTLPAQQVLTWTFPSVSSMATQTVEYKTTPESGACAAQPLFVNTAWVKFGSQLLPTNSTYHQGAGVAIVTFSALAHGEIYNDEMQAVDFNTAARSGVLVVPDEGYAFVGWSHEEYISLKGEVVPAQNGIMEYDTLTVYGNVELQANFVRKDEVANENVSDAVIDAQDRASQNKVWSSGQNLYVQVKESGCVIRIYNTEGTLIRQLATVSDGTTTIDNLSRGIYIVTVNGQAGNKVRIE